MDVLTPEQRRKNMRNIRSKDTLPELALRKALWSRGYRYRKNYGLLPGKPDIALTKYKLAVFVDGEYFHGKDWDDGQKNRVERGNHAEYWVQKIERNIQRDLTNEADLKGLGWKSVRFWGQDILKDPEKCVDTIEEMIFERRLE